MDFVDASYLTAVTLAGCCARATVRGMPENWRLRLEASLPGQRPGWIWVQAVSVGVLMLADSVEAASRSLREPNEKSISDLVDRIVKYKLNQDQLKDSDITLKEIETIKTIFKRMLMSIYHVRVEY